MVIVRGSISRHRLFRALYIAWALARDICIKLHNFDSGLFHLSLSLLSILRYIVTSVIGRQSQTFFQSKHFMDSKRQRTIYGDEAGSNA